MPFSIETETSKQPTLSSFRKVLHDEQSACETELMDWTNSTDNYFDIEIIYASS
jgi:hypothetical protein